MIQIPVDQVIKKIQESTGISEEEIVEQIEKKLKSLDGLVSKEGAAYIIASELGVKLFDETSSSGSIKIGKVLAGMRNVEVVGKVVRLFNPITFEKNGVKGQVGSFVLGDETGTIRVVIWDERVSWFNNELKEGDVIKIKGAYSKEGNRGLEIHLARRSQLVLGVEDKIEVSFSKNSNMEYSKIKDVKPNERYRIVGTVVQLFNPYFYAICPKCGKKVIDADEGAICGEHGKVEAGVAMVFSFILDDGTDFIRCVAFRERAEMLVNMKASEAKEILDAGDQTALRESIESNLLARTIEIDGNIRENLDFERIELLVNNVNMNPNAKAYAEKMFGD